MLLDTQFKLKDNPYYVNYLRYNSYWYKTLTRNPNEFNKFKEEYKSYEQEIKISKITKTLDYLEMFGTIMSTLK